MTDLSGWVPPLVLALAPGGVKLWIDRSLARRLDDPALPERLMARRSRMAMVVAVPLAVTVLLWPARLPWSGPLLIAAFVAAGFPLRRRLHGETWSLPSYLWFMLRWTVATWGFWLLLVCAPVLADRAGWQGWAAAGAVAAVLLSWNERFADVLRFAARARPVDRPDLLVRFEALVARTQLATPRFDEVPLRGGVVANALALPSVGGAGVLFTETLLNRFTADEVTAVCAHELAHLEYFNPERVRRMRLRGALLILVGTLWSPMLRAWGQPVTWPWLAAFAVLVVSFLVVLAHGRQQHETASDVRAVALTGDPEPLVSALVKLHVLARLPRRWDQAVEQQASHPSLARRIQAIRAAAQAAPASLGDASTFVDARQSTAAATFHDDRIVWSEGEQATHSMPYGQLTELRVKVGRGESAELVASDRKGRRWTLVLASADVARAQSVLDVVDVRLSPASVRSASHPITALVALLAGLIAMAAGQVAAALVVLAVALESSAPVAAAAGTASLVGAVLLERDGAGGAVAESRWPALVLVLAGAFLISIAWRERRAPVRPAARRLVAIVAACAALLLVPVVVSSTDLLGFHLVSRAWSAFTVLALSGAAALLLGSERWRRPVSVAAATLGLASLAGGTTTFLDRAIDDPFLVAAPQPREAMLASPILEMDTHVTPTDLRLSPDGRAIALVENDDERRAQRIHVGRMKGPLSAVEASDAQFVDEQSLIVLAVDGDDMVVRRVDVAAVAIPAWEHRVPRLVAGALSVDVAARTWMVLGHEVRGAVVAVKGDVAGGGVSEQRWGSETVQDAEPVGVAGSGLVAMDFDYTHAMPGLAWTLTPSAGMLRAGSQIWRVGAGDREPVLNSTFSLACSGVPRGPNEPICTFFDGRRAHVVSVDLEHRSTTGIALIHGQVFFTGFGHGWLTGWSQRGRPFALHLGTGTLIRPPGPARGSVQILSPAGPWVATASNSGDATTVRLYAAPLAQKPG